jgi:hypothetical protein
MTLKVMGDKMKTFNESIKSRREIMREQIKEGIKDKELTEQQLIRHICKFANSDGEVCWAIKELKKVYGQQAKQEFLKELDSLIGWGESEEKNNNIYRKGQDELNEDWIDKIEELKQKQEEE